MFARFLKHSNLFKLEIFRRLTQLICLLLYVSAPPLRRRHGPQHRYGRRLSIARPLPFYRPLPSERTFQLTAIWETVPFSYNFTRCDR